MMEGRSCEGSVDFKILVLSYIITKKCQLWLRSNAKHGNEKNKINPKTCSKTCSFLSHTKLNFTKKPLKLKNELIKSKQWHLSG